MIDLLGPTIEPAGGRGATINRSEPFRSYATDDQAFDPIRDAPAFKELIGRYAARRWAGAA